MESIKTDWNKYFYDLHERFFRRIKSNYEKQINDAGNPDFVKFIYVVLSSCMEVIEGRSEFLKELREIFDNAYRFGKSTAVESTLLHIKSLKEKHLKAYEKERNRWHTPKRKIMWRNFFKKGEPKIVWGSDRPIRIYGKYDDLIFETDERKFVKYLVYYFTFQKFKYLLEQSTDLLELTHEEREKRLKRLFDESEGKENVLIDTNLVESNQNTYPQIEWLGTQKELGELFVELKKKGWIKDIDSDLIKAYFSKSDTIKQVLKPSLDTKTGENYYEAIYTPKYSPKFDAIRIKK